MTTTSLTHVWWLSLSNHKRKVVSKLTYFSCCFDQIIRSDKFFANYISSRRGNSFATKAKLECTYRVWFFIEILHSSVIIPIRLIIDQIWINARIQIIFNFKYISWNWNHEIILLKYFCCVKNLLKCQVFIFNNGMQI